MDVTPGEAQVAGCCGTIAVIAFERRDHHGGFVIAHRGFEFAGHGFGRFVAVNNLVATDFDRAALDQLLANAERAASKDQTLSPTSKE